MPRPWGRKRIRKRAPSAAMKKTSESTCQASGTWSTAYSPSLNGGGSSWRMALMEAAPILLLRQVSLQLLRQHLQMGALAEALDLLVPLRLAVTQVVPDRL